MTGPKTNEREGTKARLVNVRGSASKARRVLNMIRNRSVHDARSILQFSDVGMSDTVGKLLESAVANASHNDGIEDHELYVSACFADEGITMKRFRPRARGSSARINKRMCHITLVVTRYDDEELQARDERLEKRQASSAAKAEARRRRVASSRAAVTDDSGEEETQADVAAASPSTATEEEE